MTTVLLKFLLNGRALSVLELRQVLEQPPKFKLRAWMLLIQPNNLIWKDRNNLQKNHIELIRLQNHLEFANHQFSNAMALFIHQILVLTSKRSLMLKAVIMKLSARITNLTEELLHKP